MSRKGMTSPRGPSRRAPWIAGEDWSGRHARRQAVALADADRLRVWAADRGGSLDLKNGGEHWHLRVHGSLIQWWPKSGRVVRDARWDAAAKAHDVDQLTGLVESWRKRGKLRER